MLFASFENMKNNGLKYLHQVALIDGKVVDGGLRRLKTARGDLLILDSELAADVSTDGKVREVGVEEELVNHLNVLLSLRSDKITL